MFEINTLVNFSQEIFTIAHHHTNDSVVYLKSIPTCPPSRLQIVSGGLFSARPSPSLHSPPATMRRLGLDFLYPLDCPTA